MQMPTFSHFVRSGASSITLAVAFFLATHTAAAIAQEREQGIGVPSLVSTSEEATASTSNGANLPSLDSIDAQTDIAVFLESGVPEGVRIAALRRAWRVDPMIRDFRGLQESDWNFNDSNGIFGFGELDRGTEIKQMLAELFSEPPSLATPATQRAQLALFGIVRALPWN